ncbi:MAG: cyclase family protein [Candidatus Korarchaeota archaeon]
MMVTLIDVTLPIHEKMVIYPGDIPPSFVKETNGAFNISRIVMSSHCGTHIDAPAHIGKETTVESIPLERLMCTTYVVAIYSQMQVNIPHIKKSGIKKNAGILIKTGEGKYLAEGVLRDTHVYITEDVAKWLVYDREIKIIGIDSLSVEPPDSSKIHTIFLNAGIPIIEGLYLEHVPEGRYQMFALPIKLLSLDAAPARVVLVPKPEERPISI